MGSAKDLAIGILNWLHLYCSVFSQLPLDHYLFLYCCTGIFLVLCIYVDDLVLVGDSHDHCCKFNRYLQQCFKLKDLGPLKYFLGIALARSKDGLCPRKYALDILSKTRMLVPNHVPFL